MMTMMTMTSRRTSSSVLLVASVALLFMVASHLLCAQPVKAEVDPEDDRDRAPLNADDPFGLKKRRNMSAVNNINNHNSRSASTASSTDPFPLLQLDSLQVSKSNSARLLRQIDLDFSKEKKKPNKQQKQFCFVSHGCWGGSHFGTETQPRVAAQIAAAVRKYGARFVLAAGDNVYEKGIKSVHDKRFFEVFTDIYIKPHIDTMKDIPFIAAVGNHDARGDVFAQVNLTMIDPNWYLPHTYYSVLFPSVSLVIVVLDCPLFERCVVNPPGSPRCWDKHAQATFLEAALQFAADRGMRFRVVMCHYPMYANGPHLNHGWLKQLLDPVMEKYGVTLYINADNHYQQVSERKSVSASWRGSSSRSSDDNHKQQSNNIRTSATATFATSAQKNSIWYVNSGGGGGYRLHTKRSKGYKDDKYNVWSRIGNGPFVHCLDLEQDVIHNYAIAAAPNGKDDKELFSFDAFPAVRRGSDDHYHHHRHRQSSNCGGEGDVHQDQVVDMPQGPRRHEHAPHDDGLTDPSYRRAGWHPNWWSSSVDIDSPAAFLRTNIALSVVCLTLLSIVALIVCRRRGQILANVSVGGYKPKPTY